MFATLLVLGILASLAMFANSAGGRDNFSGDLHAAAPTGGVTAGKIYALGSVYGVARETQSATVSTLFAVWGGVWVTKAAATGKSFAIGAKLYYDATNHVVTPSATGNTLIGGYVLAAATATDTTVFVMLTQPSPSLT